MIADLEDLRKLSGYKRIGDVRRWLSANGIAFMVQSSGAPVTTLEAINIALHGNSKYNKPDFSDPPGYRPRGQKKLAVASLSSAPTVISTIKPR